MPIAIEYSIDYDIYDILPKGANADLISSVVISGPNLQQTRGNDLKSKHLAIKYLRSRGLNLSLGNTKRKKKPYVKW